MADEIRRIGAQMANVMYHLVQRPGNALMPEWLKVMDQLLKDWDAAAAVPKSDAQTSGDGGAR